MKNAILSLINRADQELGNLYSFVKNSSVQQFDFIGLSILDAEIITYEVCTKSTITKGRPLAFNTGDWWNHQFGGPTAELFWRDPCGAARLKSAVASSALWTPAKHSWAGNTRIVGEDVRVAVSSRTKGRYFDSTIIAGVSVEIECCTLVCLIIEPSDPNPYP